MELRAVHQVVPTLSDGDAVGAHTLHVRDVLRAAGLSSEVYALTIDDELRGEAHPFDELPRPEPDHTAFVYQCSVGSEVVDELLRRPEPLVVNYHNLTPVEQLLRWAPDMAHLVGWGRNQLRALAPRAALGIGDSSLNTAELARAGFVRTATVPVLLELHEGGAPARPPRSCGARWLFVGRIVPNKAQHDLVLALAWAREVHDPDATLHLVGREAAPSYRRALEALIDDLGLGASVTLTGSVSDESLAQEYAETDVFVCASDHEGFGIPLLEAMAAQVPVVAHASSAVPETVGGAGLLLPTKDPWVLAAAAHRAASDADLRAHLQAVGRRRAACYDVSITGPRFLEELRAGLTAWR